MKFGKFEISTHNIGFFRLDGGAMFGSVPKNLWSKLIPADSENCIKLATRSLLINTGDRKFLVDVGCGEKWTEKSRAIFAINNFSSKEVGFDPNQITDVILTHLHFDHAGGISRWKAGSTTEIEPCFPNAKVYLQKSNLLNAKSPNVRERASYLDPNIRILEQVRTELTSGDQEIYPNIWVHECNGHTRGQQWVEVKDGSNSIIFATDMIPTSHHLPVPYNMGYDINAELLFKEKNELLEQALVRNSIIVFQHDAEVAAATISRDDKKHFCVKEKLHF